MIREAAATSLGDLVTDDPDPESDEQQNAPAGGTTRALNERNNDDAG
jgi:hypothetical protein